MDTPPNASLAKVGQLTCLACGKTTHCLPDDLARYTRDIDWPRCCGRVMAYSPARPRAATAPDTVGGTRRTTAGARA